MTNEITPARYALQLLSKARHSYDAVNHHGSCNKSENANLIAG